MSRPSGRRPGPTRTREQLLATARQAFAATGYEATTVRSIALGAGVDPAMINHHFGGKRGLFLAALALPIDPAEEVAAVLPGPVDQLGARLVARLLRVWDSEAGVGGSAVLRTALQDARTAAAVRAFVRETMLVPLVRAAGAAAAEIDLRAALVASQLGGLIFTRHLLALDPAASADPDALAASIAPVVQHYLTDPLPSPPRPEPTASP